MSTNADGVVISSLTWSDITMISSVSTLYGGSGADIYLEDGDGDELNLELSEEAAKTLRDELNKLYPPEEDEEEETEADEAEPVAAGADVNGGAE